MLKELLEKHQADRVTLFCLEKSKPLYGCGFLYNLVPTKTYSNLKAKEAESDKSVIDKKYSYHLFMDLMFKLFLEEEAHFSKSKPSFLDLSTQKYLNSLLQERHFSKISFYRISDDSFVSVNWVT